MFLFVFESPDTGMLGKKVKSFGMFPKKEECPSTSQHPGNYYEKILCVMNPLQYTTSLFLSELFIGYQDNMNKL